MTIMVSQDSEPKISNEDSFIAPPVQSEDGLITVSGCPRSGTSLMMDCLRLAYGDELIMGSKFPQEERINLALDKHEKETQYEFEARQYIRELMNPDAEKNFAHSRDMNPNGFWECRYSVRGIQYHLGMPDLKGKVCKIVSQGLANSNPQYIKKIIYMLRDPRQVAKSQERLRRMSFISPEEEQAMKIHTPEMFIQVSVQACQWLVANPNIPIITILFDDLIRNPDETLGNVQEFLGDVDFSTHQIDPKLKRSYPEEISHHLWEYADTIYEYMKSGEYQKVIDYYTENAKHIQRDKVITLCTRLRERMVYNECKSCQSSCGLVKNLKKRAESKKISWEFEPCMFECLTDPYGEHISIKESVRNNHWVKMLKQENPE